MIIFTCPKYFPGVKSVFRHAESLGIGKYVETRELNYSTINEDDTVIFGAWDITYGLPMHRLRFKCKKAVLWTSSPGQMEMSPNRCEISMFSQVMHILRQKKIDKLYILSRELFEYLKIKDDDLQGVFYFPAPFNPDYDFKINSNYAVPEKTNSIGLFIPPYSNVRKNYYNQNLACEMVRKAIPDVEILTNADMKLSQNWLPDEIYYALLKKVKVNLQVTHTEAFCYQVAEAVSMGTISIVSPCIQENLGLDAPFVVHNPDSPYAIALFVQHVLEMTEKEYKEWSGIQKKFLIKTAEKNNKLLRLLLS